MKKELKEYRENGIGFNCSTSELKDLNEEFKRTHEIRLEDLTFLENKREEIQDKLAEVGREGGIDALNIVKKDLLENQLEKIDKKINILVLSLSYKNMSEFISFKLEKRVYILSIIWKKINKMNLLILLLGFGGIVLLSYDITMIILGKESPLFTAITGAISILAIMMNIILLEMED